MTNRTISIIFVVISWTLLFLCAMTAMPIMSFYAVLCVGLSHAVYYRENKKR